MATIGNWTKQHDSPYSHKYYLDTTIGNGATDTDVIDTLNYEITGISTDAQFDGASLAIHTGAAADALSPVSDQGGTVRAIAIEDGEFVEVDPDVSRRWARFVKFVTSSQTGATTLRIYARNLAQKG